uniref:C2H2-type domain-containing protein n=1 Tax=Eptatretus burgeri TaxID=7764 RepID=A0A8C4WUA0_EPTBU
MNQDLYGEEYGANYLGSTSASDGRNAIGGVGSPMDRGSGVAPPVDKQSGPDFIVKVKVESEFVDVWTPQVRGLNHDFDRKAKKDPEFVDCPMIGESHPVKTEIFQSDIIQTPQEVLSRDCVKQEPCVSPLKEVNPADWLLDEKEMKCRITIPYSKCSSFFYTKDSFNQHAAQAFCHDVNKISDCASNGAGTLFSKRHKNIKKGERPHECSLCRKAFNRTSKLNQHKKSTHGRKALQVHCVPQVLFVFIPFEATSNHTHDR